MDWIHIVYAAALVLTAAISTVVGMEIWQRRSAPGGWSLLAFQTGLTLWTVFYAIHWLSSDPVLAHFWLDMTYLGVVSVPTAFLVFVLQFTFRGRWVTPGRLALLSIEPLLTLLSMATNPFLHLFHGVAEVNGLHRYFEGGPMFWVNTVYSFTLIFITTMLLLFAVRRSNFNYRRQAGTLLVGVLVPWLVNIITFAGLNPLPNLDLTPIAFSISSVFFAVALTRYQLLKVVPIARYTLVEGMTDGVIVLDDQKRVVDINPAIVRLLNTPHTGLIGKSITDILASRPDVAGICCGAENRHAEVQWNLDPPQWFDLQVNVLRGQEEQIDGWLLIWRDVTDLKMAQIFLRQSEQRYGYLLQAAAFPVVITSLHDNTVLYANRRTVELFELQGDAVGQPVPDFYQNLADRERLLAEVKKNDGQLSDFELGLKTRSGRQLWVLMSANQIEFGGQPALFVAMYDITRRRELEQELHNLQRAVDQSASTIVITDINGNITFVNPAFTRTSGYQAAEVLGQNPRILKSGEQDTEFYRALWSSITRNESWQGMFHNRRKDGTLYWESATISPIRDTEGHITHYLAVKEDITRRKEDAEKLEQLNVELTRQLQTNEELRAVLKEQSIRDPLTNLHNRRFLAETLPREFARAEREGYPISILMVDIDRFKIFNDTYGHDAGDLVLKSLANCLMDNTRGEDYVVRYGGEEVLVILINTPLKIALERGEALRATFEALVISFGGKNLGATISVGAASYPLHGASPEAVIRAADLAMYRAKAAGRNRVSD